jgi:hypothetical protein
MLCLACAHDEQSLGPVCSGCGSYVGYVAEGRGYLPQLKVLEVGLAEGRITAEESEQRLQRLDGALEALLGYLDECGQGLMSLQWDDVQQGTLGGFMMPIREGLDNLRALLDQLDSQGGWGEELWAQLDQAQTQVYQGNEGLTVLMQTLAGCAVEQGVDREAAAAE